jgi:acetolactate synthase I/II/III large subunit
MAATGAAVLVRALKAAGVERIFTLSGNQILPIYDACLDEAIAITDTRHEGAAAHMADAWARLRGVPGVCLVSAGPGHTNALTAVLNARLAESPVLWLSGGSDRATFGQGGFQELDQPGIAAHACKAAWRVEEARELPAFVARAWATMLSGRPGPVHLTLPADLLAGPVDGAVGSGELSQPLAREADPEAIGQTLAVLAAAERPLVLVSPSVARGAAGAALAAFGAATGIPAFTIDSPRGLTDPALHDAGAIFRAADAILLLAPQDYAVGFAGPKAFDPQAVVIQVAPAASEPGRAAIGLVGDAAAVLAQLHASAAAHVWGTGAWRARLDAARADGRARFAACERSDETPIHPLRLLAEVRALLPPDAAVTIDGGEFAQWARWAFGDWSGPVLVNGKLGMIGPAIPFAIGAASARPAAPAVAFLGDGTFGYHALEFDTAVRHNVPFVAIVGNDATWAAERHRQVAFYGPDRVVASALLPSRYDQVVSALGGYGEFVQRPAEIRPAVERALASGKPACVNVLVASVPSPASPV